LGFGLLEGGWKASVAAAGERYARGDCGEDYFFQVYQCDQAVTSGRIPQEGGSRPKVIALESVPVMGSQSRSVSPLKASSCEVWRIA